MKATHIIALPAALVGVAVFGWVTFAGDSGDASTVVATPMAAEVASAPGVVQVWKSPTCGCCSKWIEHLEAAGFTVEANDVQDMLALKAQHGIPSNLQSCHTALVDGYLIEGHVPVEDVQRLLAERPEVSGLAVPGMPVGSPGMEMGDEVQPYEVLTFDGRGETEVFSRHGN